MKPIKVKSHYEYLREHPEFTGCLIDQYDGKYWYKNGEWHREDGPALEFADGSKAWCKNGEWHREDGPAVERADGSTVWYLNGKELTEQEHRMKVRQIKLKLLDKLESAL